MQKWTSTADYSWSQKRGDLPSCDRRQPIQHVCRELPFSNGEHFLTEDTPKKGRLNNMHRPKGCISLCPHTQFLTKVPVFSMEKQMLCNSRLAIWAKYRSHCIYNATCNKTHSSLLGEKMYLNNRLPRQLANLGFLHKRLKSKHWTNARPSPVARFRRKLGEVHSSPHLVIAISGLLHRFTDNVTQPPRDKDPEHTESKWQTLILNSTPSACKVASLIGRLEAACPSIWQAPLHYRGLQRYSS